MSPQNQENSGAVQLFFRSLLLRRLEKEFESLLVANPNDAHTPGGVVRDESKNDRQLEKSFPTALDVTFDRVVFEVRRSQ